MVQNLRSDENRLLRSVLIKRDEIKRRLGRLEKSKREIEEEIAASRSRLNLLNSLIHEAESVSQFVAVGDVGNKIGDKDRPVEFEYQGTMGDLVFSVFHKYDRPMRAQEIADILDAQQIRYTNANNHAATITAAMSKDYERFASDGRGNWRLKSKEEGE